MSRGPLGNARPLSLAALDAAISETIGAPARRDRLARDDRVYRWIVRRAIAEGSTRFNCTYAEAAAGAGYDVPRLNCRANRREARERRVSTVYRALQSLAGAGLVRFRGVKRENGQWRCLSIVLTPAAYGAHAPFGRSRRGPHRRPGNRISFSRRNGTSPTVETSKNAPESADVRGRARAGPREAGEEGDSPWLAALRATEEAGERADAGPAAWPWDHAFISLHHERCALLVDAFERHFGLPAHFSFRRHGPELERVLERIDRFSGPAGDRWGYDAAGRRRRAGAGFHAALELIRRHGRAQRLGPRAKQPKIRSLAYFIPKLDQMSKQLRRAARAREGRETWGPIKEE